jgi:hypothetical protein
MNTNGSANELSRGTLAGATAGIEAPRVAPSVSPSCAFRCFRACHVLDMLLSIALSVYVYVVALPAEPTKNGLAIGGLALAALWMTRGILAKTTRCRVSVSATLSSLLSESLLHCVVCCGQLFCVLLEQT